NRSGFKRYKNPVYFVHRSCIRSIVDDAPVSRSTCRKRRQVPRTNRRTEAAAPKTNANGVVGGAVGGKPKAAIAYGYCDCDRKMRICEIEWQAGVGERDVGWGLRKIFSARARPISN